MCLFCHCNCGERSFCDEVCYDEYQAAQAERMAGYAEELPGESRVDVFDEPPVFDGDF